MTIGRKIIGGYLVLLALLGAVLLVTFYSTATVERAYNGFIDVETQLMRQAGALRAELNEQVATYRAVLLFPAQQETYRRLLEQSRERFDDVVKAMARRTEDPDSRAMIDEIAEMQARNRAAQDRVLETAAQRKPGGLPQEAERVRTVNDDLVQRAERFRERQAERLDEGRARVRGQVVRAELLAALISIVGLVAGIGLGVYLSRAITRQLQGGIAQLSSSASEILATTSQVASGAAETATAVSQTTATVEEVKQTAQLANQKARQVSDSAQKAAQVSVSGRKSVEDSIAGMQRIHEQMQSIAESIVRLSEQSQAIGEIIATVNDLAEQSNLLAVNAAIEASRAGEQGKAFGVVAQEVRNLAGQSKQATAQVRTILGDIQKATGAAVLATEQGSKAVEAGVQQSASAGESIRMLADSIAEAAHAALQIAASSQQQMVGMDQVALAMENIKQASMQNVSGTKQAEVAARGLHELGHQLGALIGRRAT